MKSKKVAQKKPAAKKVAQKKPAVKKGGISNSNKIAASLGSLALLGSLGLLAKKKYDQNIAEKNKQAALQNEIIKRSNQKLIDDYNSKLGFFGRTKRSMSDGLLNFNRNITR